MPFSHTSCRKAPSEAQQELQYSGEELVGESAEKKGGLHAGIAFLQMYPQKCAPLFRTDLCLLPASAAELPGQSFTAGVKN